MNYRSSSTALFRIAAVCATLFGASNAFALIIVNFTFDQSNLVVGGTGTFTLSGSATATGGGSQSWQATEPGDTEGWFTLNAITVNTHGVAITNNGNPFTPQLEGQQFFNAGGGTSLLLNGQLTPPSPNLLVIGNGTTDFISGTFQIMDSPNTENPGSFTIEDLNVPGTRYTVNASAVPEPATYSVLAGAAVMGLACVRRRRRNS